MIAIRSRLSAVQLRWRDPFGVAVGVFAGGPAFFDESVVDSAGQGQLVDVGAAGGLPRLLEPMPEILRTATDNNRRHVTTETTVTQGITGPRPRRHRARTP
ncbi:hypothetical protein B1T43_17925 [Mycobacterium kansasii]|nr:hypothetical protein B1T43_17925 [Mycobacterium kansasii]